MKTNQAYAASALGAIVIVAAGFFAGRTLKQDPTPGYAFDLSAPSYTAELQKPGLSKGGFSGFGETAGLPGQSILSGKVTSVTAQEVVIEGADGTRTALRLANPSTISRIEAANRDALRNGATVVLRQAEGSDQIEAVLVIGSP